MRLLFFKLDGLMDNDENAKIAWIEFDDDAKTRVLIDFSYGMDEVGEVQTETLDNSLSEGFKDCTKTVKYTMNIEG